MSERSYSQQSRSPLLVNSSVKRFVIHLLSWCFFLFFKRKDHYSVRTPHKILICNMAHLGDVILATSILPLIYKQFPRAEISFLTGSWNRGALENHTHVKRVHYLDHWKLNRSKKSLFNKVGSYLFKRRSTLREIQAEGYDCAIDLYPFFPNNALLLYQASIPMRIGYTSAGLGQAFTHPMDWLADQGSIVYSYRNLLCKSHLVPVTQELLCPNLTYTDDVSLSQNLPEDYSVIHIGAGHYKKEWDLDKWKELIHLLVSRKEHLVLTGKGEREKKMIEEACKETPQTINLCDQLTIRQLIKVIQSSRLLIAVDSAVGHIASAYQIPTVILFAGINDQKLWAPQNEKSTLISQKPFCFPCLKKEGCLAMSCIKDISVSQVMHAAERWL